MHDVQRVALVAARLVALANGHLGMDVQRAMVTELGSAGAAVAAGGKVAFDPGNGSAGVGAALSWALRVTGGPNQSGLDEIHVVAEPNPDRRLGIWARQAQHFAPAPQVWQISSGTAAGSGELLAVEPEPFPARQVPPPQTAELELLLRQAGLEVVVEHGVILGELRGLEVARVEVNDTGEPELQVGVGRLDREATALLHADLTRPEALTRVVELISPLRAADAAPHPVNRMSRERWVRHRLLAQPSLVGAATLEPAEATEPRAGLRDPAVAVAVGERPDGTPVVVVTSDGADLDAVPKAADARAWHAPDADLLVVVPTGNRHPTLDRLAATLTRPAQVLDLAPDWPR